MPDSWQGELYEDSKILTQTLYTLRDGALNANHYNLGKLTSGPFNNLPMADVLVWSALFYFPDSFANFHEAMMDACRQLRTSGCSADLELHIDQAFSEQGIAGAAGDGFEVSTHTALCTNNNGPECATDISTMTALLATIYPAGDADFYSLPIGAGNFQASLTLPLASGNEYKAYGLYLFDSNRNYLVEAVPAINNWDPVGLCVEGDYTNSPIDCTTYDAGVTLTYNVTAAGRYYLMVAGGPNKWNGNSGVHSPSTYTLTVSYAPRGGATAYTVGTTPDNDTIGFTVPYNLFPSYSAPVSSALAVMGGHEQHFAYAQLRDHNGIKLDLARTNLTPAQGSYLQLVNSVEYITDFWQHPIMRGNVQLQPGFAARYPGVGTVELEIFGRNHMGNIISLGISGAFNLSTAKTEVKAYNNVMRAPGAKAKVRYDLQSAGNLTIKVYTQTGALVKTIYDGPASGKGTVEWDGTNLRGEKVASGIYFLKASGPGLNKTEKIAIVR